MQSDKMAPHLDAVSWKCSVPKFFVEVSQNSQEKPVLESLFNRPATSLKKRLWHRCFRVNFAKFNKKPFLTEHLWWLLLHYCLYSDFSCL